MSLKVSDMVLIPQGVLLWAGESPNIALIQNNGPQYGIILEDKILDTQENSIFKNYFPIAIGNNKYYVKEEDVYLCS